MNNLAKIKELIKILNQASTAYYGDNNPTMSDKEYDELYDELVDLEDKTEIIMANSPTQSVQGVLSESLPKVQHPSTMLSLDKTKDPEEVKKWLGNKMGILSWKEDGITLVAQYKEGTLDSAVTRGNGEMGELITNNAKHIKNIPLKIPFKGKLVVRGEAVITYPEFKRINNGIADMESKYKNPRNLCSGTVRNLNSDVLNNRQVKFIAFQLISAEGMDLDTVSSSFEWLSDLGFEVVGHEKVNANNIVDTIYDFEKRIIDNEIPSDGLVIAFDDIAYGQSLGTTGKFPRHSLAFKWKDETAETILREVEWNTSKTGLINPVAIFDPVELEGTTVERASLHNLSIIEELELGIGDEITVYKANMIVPQVDDNLSRSNTLEIPNRCPCCGETTEIYMENNSKTLRCSNQECPAQLLARLVHFTSRNAMDIEGLSERNLARIIPVVNLKKFIQIYDIERFRDKLVGMEGFGVKSVEKLLVEIRRSKRVKLENFINALSIPTIGYGNSKAISKYFCGDWKKLSDALCQKFDFTAIDGIGQVMNNAIYKWLIGHHTELIQLADLMEFQMPEIKADKFHNINFAITGKLNNHSRDELKAEIEAYGGTVNNTVTRKTDYLVNNSTDSTSSKNQRAKCFGVKIVTEDEVIRMMTKF